MCGWNVRTWWSDAECFGVAIEETPYPAHGAAVDLFGEDFTILYVINMRMRVTAWYTSRAYIRRRQHSVNSKVDRILFDIFPKRSLSLCLRCGVDSIWENLFRRIRV